MDIHAYIIEVYNECESFNKIVTIKVQNKEPFFNITQNEKFFDMFKNYVFDTMNEYNIGEMEIGCEEWNDLLFEEEICIKDINHDTRFTKEQQKIIKEINEWINKNDVLFLECY